MYKIYSKNNNYNNQALALGLGTFDGVHLGHQKLINNIINYKEYLPAIITFDVLPAQYFSGQNNILINTLEERIELFYNSGIEHVIVFDFIKIKELTVQEYLNLLETEFNIKAIITGKDHIFGKNKKGNVQILKNWADAQNIQTKILEFEKINSTKISSSTIRQLLTLGNIPEANNLLGYEYNINSNIISGEGLGTEMQVPTYNINYPENKTSIPLGVYAVKFNNIPAIANYGLAPTLKILNTPVLECHLLDTSNITNQEINNIKFYKYIRPEKKFNSQEELKAQILQDINIVNKLFS